MVDTCQNYVSTLLTWYLADMVLEQSYTPILTNLQAAVVEWRQDPAMAAFRRRGGQLNDSSKLAGYLRHVFDRHTGNPLHYS